MSAVPRRVATIVVTAGLALLPAACGNRQDTVTQGETEGSYLDVGDLTYQVQVSRQLNPRDREDRAYLAGLPPAQLRLAPDEAWFGVFIRVTNESESAQTTSDDFEIVDTSNVHYRPLPLPVSNVFAYRAVPVPGGSVYPQPSTAASYGPTQGSLLLFRVKLTSLDNRPLEFKVRGAEVPETEASVDLDV